MLFDIFIQEDTIRISTSSVSEQVFGVLSISIDNTWFFPEKTWDDFILIVLEWWSNEALKVIWDQEAEFFFMDGGFFFKINPDGNNINGINIIFFDNNVEVKNINIDKIDFLSSIKKALNLILRHLVCIGYNKNKSYNTIMVNFQLICQYIKSKKRHNP